MKCRHDIEKITRFIDAVYDQRFDPDWCSMKGLLSMEAARLIRDILKDAGYKGLGIIKKKDHE